MPLYNQSTNLAAQGKFAPGVSYRADVRKPTQSMPDFPKGQYSFNVNMDSIGKALANMSRDQASVEETKFKLEYAQKEKAEAAAEKQLKINMSNAYAQEIANVTAEVDQGRTDPIAANRKIKSIDDKYFSYGVLSASEMAPIRNNYDGGISQYQKNTREQLRDSEIAFQETKRQEFLKAVPSASNLSREEQLRLEYNLSNADLQLGDAVKIYNNDPSSVPNQSLLQDKANLVADYEAKTVVMNALNNDHRYSEADMFNMTVGNVDNVLAQRGVNSQMRAYAAKKAWERYGSLAELKAKASNETLTYLQNKNKIWDAMVEGKLRYYDPVAMSESVARSHGLTTWDETTTKERTVEIPSGDGLGTKQLIRWGGYSREVPTYTSDASGNITDTKTNVPETYREYVTNSNLPVETKSLIAGVESVPAGPVGNAVSIAAVSGSYDKNVRVPGEVLYNKSTTPAQISTAYENNAEYMKRTLDNSTTMQNIRKQDEHAGTTYEADLKKNDRREVYNSINIEPARSQANDLYENHVKKFSPKGEYSSKFYSSLVLDENTGTLSMLNKYQTSGLIDDAAALLTAYNAKQSVAKINEVADNIFPNSIEGRNQFIRSLFDGMYPNEIQSYQPGMGGATLKPTTSETAAAKALDAGDWAADKFQQYVLTPIKKAWNIGEKELAEKYGATVKAFEEDYAIEKKRNPSLTQEEYARDFFIGIVKDITNDALNSFKEAVQSTNTSETTEATKSEERDWDLQRGPVDIRGELPIHISEDGDSWGNMRYGTITADGRTFVVPGFDEKGNMSDPKTEFDKGRWFFSIAGDDDRSIAMAEGLGAKTREWVIERDAPKAEKLMQQKKESIKTTTKEPEKSTQTATDERGDLNAFQKFLEKNNIIRFKNPKTDEEKAVKQNLQDSVEIGKQIENISDAALVGAEGMAEEIKNLGINPEEAAVAITYIEDEAARDRWLEEYNRLGEMTYPDIRQMMFIGASITPAIFALGGKGAVKVSDYIDDFVGYLRNKSGTHLETNKEKRQREELEREDRIKEAFKKNQELFYNRYSTWRRFFTTGLYNDSGFETLDLEAVE